MLWHGRRTRSSRVIEGAIPTHTRRPGVAPAIHLPEGLPARHMSVAVSPAVRASRARSLTRHTPEPYLTRGQMAELMGVSLATLDRMVAEGMPSVTWGRRTRRFRPSRALAWAEQRSRP